VRGFRLTSAASPAPKPSPDSGRGSLRSGLRNGILLGVVAIAAVALLNHQELPGLGRIVAELPLAVAIAAAVHIPQIALTALAWTALLPPAWRPGFGAMVTLRWYRESANALLPAGALVGQAAAARLLARRGVPGDVAGATATVDLTMEAVSQLLFTLAGVALLAVASGIGDLAGVAAAGVALAVLGAGAMVAAQRRLPVGLLERLLRRLPGFASGAVASLQAAIRDLHAQPRALAVACLWHLAAWLLGAVEVMGVLHLLGQDISYADALVIESLAQALRNAGFLLPGALAVQEGAFIAAAALVGVPTGPALAMALTRRCREVLFAIPGLLAWQRAEMRAWGRP